MSPEAEAGPPDARGRMRQGVQLIAYADRLAGDLPGLADVLDGPLAGLFTGVHVLPCFRPYDGADAGFDPEDHTEIDPRLGTWEDLARLGERRDLVVDAIVNHISAGSSPFRDWLARGDASPAAGMFLTFDSVYPRGATEGELLRTYRPRPGLPFTPVVLADGRRRLVWTTFTSNQVDLDITHPAARDYLRSVLERLSAAGVTAVRLDAVGYVVKTPGTTSFMTPETLAVVDELTALARGLGLEVLVEVHAYYRRQLEVAGRVDWVYDFALPPLVLHALLAREAGPLRHWLGIRPANAFTVLDTHDGIGVLDVAAAAEDPAQEGLLDPGRIRALVAAVDRNSGGTSVLATGAAASNLDLYQVNCTFYDALARDDARYLLARALQFFVPGVPQVYYVGLLAGVNDTDLLARTGVGRDVNRRRYDRAQLEAALERPVVRALARLIRFRNRHPAFAGVFDAPPTGGEDRLALRWRAEGGHEAVLTADLASGGYELRYTAAEGPGAVRDAAALPF